MMARRPLATAEPSSWIQRQATGCIGSATRKRITRKTRPPWSKENAVVIEETRAGILDIDLHAEGRRCVTGDGLGDSEDAERVMGQAVLKDSDNGAECHAGDLITPRHSEEDRDQQWQIKDRHEAHVYRQE